MGAFGELLIQYLGGDLDHYRGNDKCSNRPDIPVTEEEKQKSHDELVKRFKLKDAREHLHRLTTNIMYKFVDHTKITEEIFRNGYKSIKTEEWVIDTMWNEYNDFLIKYVINK